MLGLEEEVEHLARGVLAAREKLGGGASTHVEVGAAGRADRAAGVLVEHEVLVLDEPAREGVRTRVDHHEPAAREDRLVGRDRGVLVHARAERTRGPRALVVLLEEHIRVVLVDELVDDRGARLVVAADRRERELALRDEVRLHHRLAEADILAVGLAGVADVHDRAVGHDELGAAVHLHDVDIERVLEVDELGALEHAARLDLGAARPLRKRAVGHAAAERLARRRIGDEVRRTRVERMLESRVGRAARVEGRREVAREEHIAVLVVADRLPHIEDLEELRLEVLLARRGREQFLEREHARGGLLMRADLLGRALVLEGEPLLARGLLEPPDALVDRAIEVEGATRKGRADIWLGIVVSELDERRPVGRVVCVGRDFLLGPASCQGHQRR